MNLTPVRTPAWRRIMSFCLVLVMLAALVPASVLKVSAATPSTLYLKPNNERKTDGARFAAYFFGNGEKWLSMTDSDGDGVYEVAVPSGFPSVIFCRMNPSATANNWNNRWNQTGNLTVPTDGKNCFTVPSGAWNGSTTGWSTYTPSTPTEPTTAPTTPSGEASDWYLKGTLNNWGNTNRMYYTSSNVVSTTVTLAAGTYSFKLKSGNTWLGNTGTINDATGSGGWDFYVTDVCKLKASGGTYTFTFNTID